MAAERPGEDVVELQCHGSPVQLQVILRECLSLGARAAEPGEFSQRAFLNGKLDLTQAEAVARKLVADGVSLVIGHRSSDMTRAAAPIYAAAGIVQITPR